MQPSGDKTLANPTIHVWITKHALTTGIIEAQAEHCLDTVPSGSMILITQPIDDTYDSCYFHGEGNNWHRTREAAIAKAEEMRHAKIASLQKQIANLRTMIFK